MKELLTASRMNCLVSCARKHFWRYECGLKPTTESEALRFGTAWHAGMEARWNGKTYEEALNDALATAKAQDLDEVTVAKLSAMLAAYYRVWQEDPIKELHPEIQFHNALEGSRTFDIAGKIDGLGWMQDGRKVKVEHKTTIEQLDADSDYWLKLRADLQVTSYVSAARSGGFVPEIILYDVARKPGISPKQIPVLDESGAKIVLDPQGQRVFNKNGSPKESGDTKLGYEVQSRVESPGEYCDRLYADILERPEFYFARREVPVLDRDIEEFECQRIELGKLILAFRQAEKRVPIKQLAWPRNVGMTCRMGCENVNFCLNNIEADENHIPSGFMVAAINPELETVKV
jgi:hypothetical protein